MFIWLVQNTYNMRHLVFDAKIGRITKGSLIQICTGVLSLEELDSERLERRLLVFRVEHIAVKNVFVVKIVGAPE